LSVDKAQECEYFAVRAGCCAVHAAKITNFAALFLYGEFYKLKSADYQVLMPLYREEIVPLWYENEEKAGR